MPPANEGYPGQPSSGEPHFDASCHPNDPPLVDHTLGAIEDVINTLGGRGGDKPTYREQPYPGPPSTTEAHAARSEPPATPAEIHRYFDALRWHNHARDRGYIPDDVRRNRDLAYKSLRYIQERYAKYITPDMQVTEVAGVLEAGVKHYRLQQEMTAGEYAAVTETLDLLREYADDPEEVRLMIALHNDALAQQTNTDSGIPQRSVRPEASQTKPANPYEQLDDAEVAQAVIEAAMTTAVIGVGVAIGSPLRRGSKTTRARGGYNTFGPRGMSESDLPRHLRLQPGTHNDIFIGDPEQHRIPQDIVEAFSFTPTQFVGPDGQAQSGKYFDYTYNPGMAGSSPEQRLSLPEYLECNGSRTGNNLVVRVFLPTALADELQARIERTVDARQDPTYLRQVVEEVVLQAGALDRDSWEYGTGGEKIGRLHRSKPPYERLPYDHTIYKLEPYNNPSSHRQGYSAHPMRG